MKPVLDFSKPIRAGEQQPADALADIRKEALRYEVRKLRARLEKLKDLSQKMQSILDEVIDELESG